MNKYVLYTLLHTAFFLVIAPVSVFAEYINENLLREKSENFLEGKDYDIKPDQDYINTLKEFSLEEVKTDLLTVGIRPPIKFPQPLVVESDSIDIKNAQVRRETRIPGIRVEKYYVIPLDDYKQKTFEDQRESLWRKNDSRMAKWIADTKKVGTSVSDLQFALPVGKRFEQFVGGKTRLDINGSQKITFSGRSEWTEGQIETAASKNSSFPALTMKQEPRFSIAGNVGDRVNVDIRQDSQTQSFSNLEENVSIKYKGIGNEIVQSIEAGNTSLNLPGATFAGYRGSHKGLFGIRTEGQLGPLKFTAIASQEKSEANVKSFRGSAEESSNKIRDYQYKTNTYFYLDKRYMKRFAEYRTSLDLIMFDPADSVRVLEVYVDDGNSGNNLDEGTFAIRGVAVPENMDANEQIFDPLGIDGFYHRLDPRRDYYVDRNLGFIVFTNRIQDSWTVGVFIMTKDGRQYGDLSYDPNNDTSKIKLKLVKAKNQRPSNKDTWDLEWKNVYDLGQRNIDIEGIEIRIFREATDGVSRDTQDGVPYIHILGLDNADEFGNQKPDNKIDLNRNFVNPYRGELIFPLLRPFDSVAPAGVTTQLKEKVPEIYETNNQDEKIEATKYYIEVKTASRSAVIRLNTSMGGIMEGTEQVILNGNPLKNGVDYRISYQTGEVTLLNEEAMSPTADLVIKYEEMNAFQQMQKTLLGFRGEYAFLNESRIGTTLLFNSESTRDKRVRLGQEPSRMLLFDSDVLLNFQPEFLTKAIDMLPMIKASEPSKIQIEGEIAKSMPTMNTRGIVYIDDFEGSRNTPLSVTRTNWTPASIPDSSTTGGVAPIRGRLQWYNPWDRIESRKIWPNKETTAGQNTVHVLTLEYGKPEDVPEDRAFAGIQTAFYGAGEDLSRARFIEIWARGGKGQLKIDLGSISEDYFPLDNPNGLLDTEDQPIPGQGQGNGELEKDEDTGLDGVFDRDETGAGPDPHGDNFLYNEKDDYSHINGAEGNSGDSDRAGFPDTEDINNNGIIDLKNSYYEYTVDFEDHSEQNKYLVQDSVPSGNPAGWRLFRIPLWNNPFAAVGGTGAPDSTLIEFARMLVTNTDTTFIQIASIEVVENSWLERGIVDGDEKDVTESAGKQGEFMKVTRVNTDENLDYTPPPGVKLEIDPDTKIRRMEQSLVLEFENLSPGNTAFLYKTFEKMDFTDYTSLRMYVHGSDTESMPDVAMGGRDMELIFRFGGDKDNYYEYRTPVFKGWEKDNYVDIDFTSCTSVKFKFESRLEELSKEQVAVTRQVNAITDSLIAIDSSLKAVKDSLLTVVKDLSTLADELRAAGAVPDTIGTRVYSLKGNPSLQNIKVVTMGIRNNYTSKSITGDIWFDELRMDSLREMGGTAARVKLNTDFAGFINITGDASTKSRDFHDMNTKKGTGNDSYDWNSSLKINFDRFTPKRWNLNLPVSANISKTEALPWLKSGSDIILEGDKKREYLTSSNDKKYHITYRKGVDTTRKTDTLTGIVTSQFLNWTTEKVSADFDHGNRFERSPMSGTNETDSKQLKIVYDVNPRAKSFKPFGWITGDSDENKKEGEEKKESRIQKKASYFDKITGLTFTYMPNEMNYNYTFDERDVYKTNIDGVSDTTKTSAVNEDYNFGYQPLQSITYRFRLSQQHDRIIDKQVSYVESNTMTFRPPGLFNLFTHNYSYTTEYNEKDNPRYSLASQLGSKTVNFNNSFSGTATLTWYAFLEKLKSIPKLPDEKDKDDTKKQTAPDEAAKPKKPAPDTKADADSVKVRKPSIPLRNRAIEAITGVFSPIALDYKTGEKFNFNGIAERPKNFLDRFKGSIDEPDTNTVVTRQNTSAATTTYSGRTDLKLPLDMGVSAQMSFETRGQKSSSAETDDETLKYPDVTFKWSNLDKRLPFINRYLTAIQLNTSYSINRQKSWQEGNDEPVTEKKSIQISQGVNTVVMKNFQTNVTVSLGRDEGIDLSGQTKSYTIDEKSDIKSQIRYRLTSSKGLPLFKNLKLKSDIDLSIDFGISTDVKWKRIGGESASVAGGTGGTTPPEGNQGAGETKDGYSKINSNDSWYVTPNITYDFSRKFKGGAKIDIKDAVDLTGKKRKTREVQIWGELTF